MSLILLMFIYIFYSVEAVKYDRENARDTFEFFKQKYGKVYQNEKAESAGFINFVHNLNEVEALNAKATDKGTVYILNKFADINPEEYLDKYAVKVAPYDNIKNNTAKLSYLLEQEEKPKGNAMLYDLNNSEQLFQEHMKKYNKTIPKSKTERTIHFLRFVKTLVEINKNNFDGNVTLTVQEDADIVKEPNLLLF